MRLGIGTVKGKWVNLHLLVSPEDPNHLVELKRFLGRLTFGAHSDSYCCQKDDLIRLGQRFDPKLTDPIVALAQAEVGAIQGIVRATAASLHGKCLGEGKHPDRRRWERNGRDFWCPRWYRRDAAAGGREIGRASTAPAAAAQRDFWLGRRGLSEEEVRQRYGSLKPCMHGSDAHEARTVGVPDGNRYSWIKGAVAFDSILQACIDPARRSFVGDAPPVNATPSQIITAVEIKHAPWAMTPAIEVNPGLVAIIGARGSGKTALADMIALGCDATSDRLSPASFLSRAARLGPRRVCDAAMATRGAERTKP